MATKFLTAKDLEVIRRNPLFERLPEDMLDSLMKEAYVEERPRGQLLFLRGEPAQWFFLVLDGWVKIFRDTPDGEQTVISVFRPGETMAEAAIFLGAPYPASAEVVNDARLLRIPAASLIDRIKADGSLALDILGTMSVRMRILISDIEQLQARTTSQRLGNFLLDLVETREGSAVIKLPYDKSLVAARLGMKPESLSRAFAKLKDLGIATRGHEVRIPDVAALEEHCQGEDL